MKKLAMALISCLLTVSTQSYAGDYIDWRKTGTDAEKQSNLINALPGTSTHMLQVAERYRTLYWAGKQHKWQFAQYQLEEIEELIKTVAITRPKRKATADQFLATAFGLLEEAINQQDQALFEVAFKHFRGECLMCHARNDHAFITLPSKPERSTSLVLESAD